MRLRRGSSTLGPPPRSEEHTSELQSHHELVWRLLLEKNEAASWNSTAQANTSWNRASWNSASWNSASWNSASWNSASRNSASWNSAYLNNASWNSECE